MELAYLARTAHMTQTAAIHALQAAQSAADTAAEASRAYADALTAAGSRDPRITGAVYAMFAASSACGDCRQAIRTMRGEHK